MLFYFPFIIFISSLFLSPCEALYPTQCNLCMIQHRVCMTFSIPEVSCVCSYQLENCQIPPNNTRCRYSKFLNSIRANNQCKKNNCTWCKPPPKELITIPYENGSLTVITNPLPFEMEEKSIFSELGITLKLFIQSFFRIFK